MPNLQSDLDEIAHDMASASERGAVARYIPELAKVDPAALRHRGADRPTAWSTRAGDADEPFSIQSISKVFTLTLALGQVGDIAVEPRRPRALRQSVQFHRPARI